MYFSVIVYNIHITTGQLLSFPSPVIPKLNLTTVEQSLISSLYSLGATPGPLLLAFGLDIIGRKGTIYVVWLMYLISWVLLWSSQNINVIYVGRLLAGLGFGGSFASVSVYISEIADVNSKSKTNVILNRLKSVDYFFFINQLQPWCSIDTFAAGIVISLIWKILYLTSSLMNFQNIKYS